MEGIQYTPDTSLDPTASAALGVWQNLQVILGQQVQRYIQAINTKNKNGKRGVSISDINGLLSFLEETINNTLSVSLKQKISISKLRTSQPKLAENEDKMKQRFRINETQLRRIVSESVKRCLNEMNGDSIRQEVEDIVRKMGSKITEWYGVKYFQTESGCDGFIFASKDEAKDCVLNGDEHQNALDLVNEMMTDEDWIGCLTGVGVNPNEARRIIQNQDWEEVVRIIVKVDGPEWFLSSYSGEIHSLSDGSLLYF